MADEIRRVDYYSIRIANKPGTGAAVLSALRGGGVNLTVVWGYPIGKKDAVLEVAADNDAALKAAAKKAKLKLGKKQTGFLIQGEDRIGAVSGPLDALAGAKINVHAVQAVCGGAGRYGAAIYVDAKDARKSAKVLGLSTTAATPS